MKQMMPLKLLIQMIKGASVYLRHGVLIGAIALLAFPSGTRAVMPPPDGGYDNFNTAEGALALCSLQMFVGAGNTGLGDTAMYFTTTGLVNTATGSAALFDNQTGGQNTATGDALDTNTTGSNNTAIGQAT